MAVALLVVGIALAAPAATAHSRATTAGSSGTPTHASVSSTSTSTAACQTIVEHDAFRNDNDTVAALANDGQASSSEQNTDVTIKDVTGFYRLSATNPNGYCVRFHVNISSEAVDPAHIPGGVAATDHDIEAEWTARHDFAADETYTSVTFTLPPATENVTFAPSKFRVASVAWASEREAKADGILGSLTGDNQDPEKDLTKRHYQFNATEDEVPQTISVPLENPQTDESIDDYNLRYSMDGGETWKPVGTDTSDPVYKRETDDGSQLLITIRDADAEVKMTANPTGIEEVQHDFTTYGGFWSGLLGGDDEDDDEDDGGLFG